MGVKPGHGGSVSIEQRVAAPAEKVSAYISDFRNAREWMVGVENVERLGEDDLPPGPRQPHRQDRARGADNGAEPREHKLGLHLHHRRRGPGGRLARRRGGCLVSYTGEFHLKRRLLDRAARFVGAEKLRPHQRGALPRAPQIPDGSRTLLMPVGLLEILLIFMVFLILGPRRIVNLFRSLGTGINDFVETLGRDKERNELPEKDEEK